MLRLPDHPAPLPFDVIDTNQRLEERRHKFMQDPDVYQARMRRELFSVELRSKTRSDTLCKRRLENEPRITEISVSNALAAANPVLVNADTSLEAKIVALKQTLTGSCTILRAEALAIMQELSVVEQAHDLICAEGLVPLLQDFLETDDIQIVHNSAFVFASLSFGQSGVNAYLVREGVVEALLRCVTVHNLKATENSLWALCNLMIDIPEVRVVLLNKGVVRLLSQAVGWQGLTVGELAATVAWFISRLCCGGLSVTDARVLVGMLKDLMELDDERVQKGAMFGLTKLLEGEAELVRQVLDIPTIDFIIKCTQSSDLTMKTYAVNAASLIAAESAEYTQHLLSCNLLTTLEPALTCESVEVRALSLLFLCNVAAWSSSMTSQLMSHNVISEAVNALTDFSVEVRSEALTFVETLASSLNLEQRLKLILVYEVLHPFKVALSLWSSSSLSQVSNICSLLLEAYGADESSGQSVVNLFESSGCYEEMCRIWRSADEGYEDMGSLLDTYFTEREEPKLDEPVAYFTFS